MPWIQEWVLPGNIRKARQKFPTGLIGYFYKQWTGDEGEGALLGSFKGNVVGVGPLILYNFKIEEIPININGRYYKEFDMKHRLKGEAAFITFSFPLFTLSK